MNNNKVSGFEALSVLTHVQHTDIRIREHNAGIDVDNAGRGYDHERFVDAETLYWTTLLYVAGANNIPNGWTIDDLFTAEYVVERVGSTDTKVLWFHINEDIYDAESRGTHYEFLYPAVGFTNAENVYAGMEIDLSDDTDGEYDWYEVDGKWFEHNNQVWFSLADRDGQPTNGRVQRDPFARVRVRTWK